MSSRTLAQALIDDAVRAATAANAAPTPVTKTSAPKAPTMAEKLSSVRRRNADLERLGAALSAVGAHGFEKLAMAEDPASTTPPSTTNGLPEPVPMTAANDQIKATNTVGGDAAGPTIIEPSGGKGPAVDALSSSPTPGQVGTDLGSGNKPATGDLGSSPAGGADGSANTDFVESKLSAAQIERVRTELRKISGGKWVDPDTARAALSRMGLAGPASAYAVLLKTSQRRRLPLATFLRGLELDSQVKLSTVRALARDLPRFKGSEDVLQAEIASAKAAVEATVKATGTLPTADEVVRAAQVDPLAANVAVYEVAELVAAAGGSVAPAGAPAPGMAPAPVPGAMAPASVMPAAPPMAAPPMAAPPMAAPAGMPAAAPMDPMAQQTPPAQPAAPAPTSGGDSEKTSQRQLLSAEVLRSLLVKFSNPTVTTAEEPTTGAPTPAEDAVEAGTVSPGTATFELTASEKAAIDSALASNDTTANSDYAVEQGFKAQHTQDLVNTPLSQPSTNGQLSTTEPVKGPQEGTLDAGAMFAGSEGGARKESAALEALHQQVRALAAGAANAVSASKVSAPHIATGRGTQEVVAAGTGFSGLAGQSDSLDTATRRGVEYVKSKVSETSRMPAIEDITRDCGISVDDAKRAIQHTARYGTGTRGAST